MKFTFESTQTPKIGRGPNFDFSLRTFVRFSSPLVIIIIINDATPGGRSRTALVRSTNYFGFALRSENSIFLVITRPYFIHHSNDLDIAHRFFRCIGYVGYWVYTVNRSPDTVIRKVFRKKVKGVVCIFLQERKV